MLVKQSFGGGALGCESNDNRLWIPEKGGMDGL